jgi:hypothetical protein
MNEMPRDEHGRFVAVPLFDRMAAAISEAEKLIDDAENGRPGWRPAIERARRKALRLMREAERFLQDHPR